MIGWKEAGNGCADFIITEKEQAEHVGFRSKLTAGVGYGPCDTKKNSSFKWNGPGLSLLKTDTIDKRGWTFTTGPNFNEAQLLELKKSEDTDKTMTDPC